MSQLILIRPEPGASASLQAAQDLGVRAYASPLFSVEAVAWQCPDHVSEFDGVLIGSANAMRHGGDGLKVLRHLPAYAVGEVTAKAAEMAGFSIAAIGRGGLQALLNSLGSGSLKLLRLAGAERIALDPPVNIAMVERIVYRVVPTPIPDDLAQRLTTDCIVACHSARAAIHLGGECDRLGLDRGLISLAVIGRRVAEAAGEGWQAIHVADAPDDRALLNLVASVLSP